MHTMITRPSGMRTPHMSWGREGRGEEARRGVEGGEGKGRGGVEGGWRSGIGQGICAAHPKQFTEESEWSDNGQLLILVPSQVIRTPLKHRWEGRGGEGRGGEGREGEGRGSGEGRGGLTTSRHGGHYQLSSMHC